MCLISASTPLDHSIADLVVALLESLLGKAFPALRSVNDSRSFQRDVKISAFDSQIEASVFILHEMQGNLRRSISSVKIS